MHCRKRNGSRILVTMVALGVTGAAFAGCRRHRPVQPDFKLLDLVVTYKLDQVLDRIKATDAQRKEFYAAKDWLLDEIAEMIERKRAVHKEMLAEFLRDEPDPETLHNMLDTEMRHTRAFAHDVLDTILHLRGQLGPEQRQALLGIAQEHLARRGGGHGFGGLFGGHGGQGLSSAGATDAADCPARKFFHRHIGRLFNRSDD